MDVRQFTIRPRRKCFCPGNPQKAKLLTLAAVCFAVASFAGLLAKSPPIACTYGGLTLLYGTLAARARRNA